MRIHIRCGNKVEPEPVLDYPFYCEHCDENVFSFETVITADATEENRKDENNKTDVTKNVDYAKEGIEE